MSNPIELENSFQQYKRDFVNDYSAPFGVQLPGYQWKTYRRHLPDSHIRSHLKGDLWVGTRAPWYPRYAYLDIDAPSSGTVERVIERCQFSSGEYHICSSPSFNKDGSVHLVFRPRYKDEPATCRLYQKIVSGHLSDFPVEVFPQKRRPFRLPLGLHQHLIDQYGAPLIYPWDRTLYFLNKLDEYDMERLPYQAEIPFSTPNTGLAFNRKQLAMELLAHGLQTPNSRHESTLLIATYYYRKNMFPEEAKALLMSWTSKKHNGYSKSVNLNQWGEIERDIEQIVEWVWQTGKDDSQYPDQINNGEGWVTRDNLFEIGKIFPGSMVNQRRLFRLLCYYNPRSHHSMVYISKNVWLKLCGGSRGYRAFQSQLMEIPNLLTINRSYKPGFFPKRFRLTMSGNGATALADDGRTIHSFDNAIKCAFPNPRNAKTVLGYNRMAIWRIYNPKEL
jgi:hypothetical protein